ncbi:hypothetical protein B0H66DRAFT_95742 [Apodospora peruviana]|uniref:DUF6594 domain-containing protein n=1 Tax=Apodospora peruviana TaxID=516989 RepID=A0AAE0IUS1_9PEZI|nr:hypothetical protein B0H66DRAFT_95742 [Apodospora peruviana]
MALNQASTLDAVELSTMTSSVPVPSNDGFMSFKDSRHKARDEIHQHLSNNLFQHEDNRHSAKKLAQQAAALVLESGPVSNVLNIHTKTLARAKNNLLYTVPGNGPPTANEAVVMNLTVLHRLSLQALRTKLARYAVDILKTDSLCEDRAVEMTQLMNTYCNALRDLDYMKTKHSDNVKEDPFKLVNSLLRDVAIMDDVKLFHNDYDGVDVDRRRRQVLADDIADPALLGNSRGWEKERDVGRAFLGRLFFGIVGGVALVAPVVLMVHLNNVWVQLSVTSAAVVLFALGMSFYSGPGATPLALVGATAAYAAVLVVFVGTSPVDK